MTAPRLPHPLARHLVRLILAAAAVLAQAEEPLFARLEAVPSRVFAGQPFTLTLSLYTTGQDLASGLRISGLPNHLRLQPFQEMPVTAQTLNGTVYQVLRNRCDALCEEPGELRFEPVLEGETVRHVQSFFFTQQIRTPVRIPLPPFTLSIQPIPVHERPPGFFGLLGAFRLEGQVSTNRALPGDLITLSYTITGRGRFDLLPTLGHDAIPGFKVYPPRLDSPSGSQTRRYTQVVIPEGEAPWTIPPLHLAAFNPDREAFDTLTTEPFTLAADADRPPDSPPPLLLNILPETAAAPDRLPIHEQLAERLISKAPHESLNAVFQAGNMAYRERRYRDAIDAYAKVRAQGIRDAALDTNLGAACLYAGQPGKAMLYVLRAIRRAPRDRVARLHLRHLQELAPRAAPPALPFWSWATQREWGAVAGLVLFLMVPAVLACRIPRIRHVARIAVGTCSLLGIVAVGGVAWWQVGPPTEERVVLESGVAGRFAPGPVAREIAAVPEGTVGRRVGTHNGWIRLQIESTALWIPAEAVEAP